jgi:uncharacterized protein
LAINKPHASHLYDCHTNSLPKCLVDFIDWSLWYCLPLAAFVCILATSSGFSGSVLFQPVFYFMLKIPLAQSIATGIATETIGMTWGALNYVLLNKKKPVIDGKAIKSIIPFIIAGVIIGLYLFVYAPKPILRFLVGLVIAMIALYQLWLAGENKFGTCNRADPGILSKPFNRIYQIFSGAFSAATGTGVAEMNQPLLEVRAGLMPLKANATAICLEAIADWVITFANITLGNVRGDILIFTVSGVLIGGIIGPRIASFLSPRITKTVFGVSVCSIGFIYMITSWPALVKLSIF